MGVEPTILAFAASILSKRDFNRVILIVHVIVSNMNCSHSSLIFLNFHAALVAPVTMPVQYSGVQHFTTLDTYFNKSLYVRLLPPVPARCPTQMGTKGPNVLPSVDKVAEMVYKRIK